jgi:hypothetical protein
LRCNKLRYPWYRGIAVVLYAAKLFPTCLIWVMFRGGNPFLQKFADEFPYASVGAREQRASRIKEGNLQALVTPPGWGGPSGELWIVLAYDALDQSGKGAGRSAVFFAIRSVHQVSCTPMANANPKTHTPSPTTIPTKSGAKSAVISSTPLGTAERRGDCANILYTSLGDCPPWGCSRMIPPFSVPSFVFLSLAEHTLLLGQSATN